jgi:hypothetical protein
LFVDVAAGPLTFEAVRYALDVAWPALSARCPVHTKLSMFWNIARVTKIETHVGTALVAGIGARKHEVERFALTAPAQTAPLARMALAVASMGLKAHGLAFEDSDDPWRRAEDLGFTIDPFGLRALMPREP